MKIAGILRERDEAVARVIVLEAEIDDLRQKLADATTARKALTGQLLLTERRASHRPPPSLDMRPCVHCGEVRLSRLYLVAGGGHSFEAGT